MNRGRQGKRDQRAVGMVAGIITRQQQFEAQTWGRGFIRGREHKREHTRTGRQGTSLAETGARAVQGATRGRKLALLSTGSSDSCSSPAILYYLLDAGPDCPLP